LFFIYQAAFGGLFFLASKEFSSAHHYHLLLSLFVSAEPIIMILAGIWISKKIDRLREQDQSKKRSSYYLLTIITFLSFLGFYFFIDSQKMLIPALGFYFLATAFFIMERIYRQRFPRDYALSYNIPFHRINAVNNLVSRGTPILSPFVLLLFPHGLSSSYIAILAFFSISSAFLFSRAVNKVSHTTFVKKETPQTENPTTCKAWGLWHVLHLATMNFAFGALFFLLSQSVLTTVSLQRYLESPVPLYIGFVGTMIVIAFGFRKDHLPLLKGVSLIIPMSLCLIGIAYSQPILTGLLLLVFGILFALAINIISTDVQQHLSHQKFSYYETRAQVFGRISALTAITLSGFLLDLGISLRQLEFIFGMFGLASFVILFYGYKKLIHGTSLHNPLTEET
jgi:hypothetical protein